MIVEIVDMQVDPANADAFAETVASLAPLFADAAGCHGLHLYRSIEQPGNFRAFVRWNSMADHVDRFQTSEAFAIWKARAGRFYARPPIMNHFRPIPIVAAPRPAE